MTTKKTLADRIAGALNGKPSSAEVDALLSEARAECEALTERKAKLKALALHPTTPAAEVKAARGKIDDAEFERDRLAAAVEHLTKAHARATHREEQGKRTGAYDEAAKRVESALARLRDRYPTLAGEIRDILLDVCEATAMANRVNANLPEGREEIRMPPEIAGYIPGAPEEIVSEKLAYRWVKETSGTEMDERHLAKEGENDTRRRILDGAIEPHYAVRRQFKEVSYHPEKSVQRLTPIYAGVALPALDAAPAFWEEQKRSMDAPAPDRSLDAAREREAARKANPVKGQGKTAEAPRPVMKRYVPIDEEQRPPLRAVS